MLSCAIGMCLLRSRKNKWLILAAGLLFSCSINPQPEPPGAEPTGHPSGGERNMATGGSYAINTGASSSGGTAAGLGGAGGDTKPPNTGVDKADASEDAGIDELDAGREPATTPEPTE